MQSPIWGPKYGIIDYLLRQKENGRIRHLGFSAHDAIGIIRKFLDKYSGKMEFCQLQLNYLDWDFQDAKYKAELINSFGIAICIMEPLRGGRLCSLPEEDMARLCTLRPQETAAGWAFRFLQSVPGVVTILSGMSNLEQARQNIATFETDAPANSEETQSLLSIAGEMVSRGVLPCTSCRYCIPHCPMELDIPALLALYNEHIFTGGGFLAPMAVDAMPENKRHSACIGCGSCEAVCPQQLKIPGAVADFVKRIS